MLQIHQILDLFYQPTIEHFQIKQMYVVRFLYLNSVLKGGIIQLEHLKRPTNKGHIQRDIFIQTKKDLFFHNQRLLETLVSRP